MTTVAGTVALATGGGIGRALDLPGRLSPWLADRVVGRAMRAELRDTDRS